MRPFVPYDYIKAYLNYENKKKRNIWDYLWNMLKYSLPIFGAIAAYNWLGGGNKNVNVAKNKKQTTKPQTKPKSNAKPAPNKPEMQQQIQPPEITTV